MSIKLDKYTPLMMYLSPASIPQIVAHIQDYLVKHPILSVETIAEIIVQSLQEHPELINGEAIPISADSAQSIKAYIDALPALDTYTKAEINALLLGKQDTLTFDQAPTPGSSNPVTSSGIIAAMSALQSALETQISAKADRASTYTKTQVDTLLEDKADADDVYTKNTMDAKLLEVNTNIDNLETAVSNQSQQIDELGPLNNLTSDSTTAALSAAQGKALKGLTDTLQTDKANAADLNQIGNYNAYLFVPTTVTTVRDMLTYVCTQVRNLSMPTGRTYTFAGVWDGHYYFNGFLSRTGYTVRGIICTDNNVIFTVSYNDGDTLSAAVLSGTPV